MKLHPWLWLAASCAPVLPPSEAELERRARALEDVPPVIPAPNCAIAASCPELAVPVDHCIDDITLFSVSVMGDAIAEVEVVPERLAELALEPGTWFTVFGGPLGGCDATAMAFAVKEAP